MSQRLKYVHERLSQLVAITATDSMEVAAERMRAAGLATPDPVCACCGSTPFGSSPTPAWVVGISAVLCELADAAAKIDEAPR